MKTVYYAAIGGLALLALAWVLVCRTVEWYDAITDWWDRTFGPDQWYAG